MSNVIIAIFKNPNDTARVMDSLHVMISRQHVTVTDACSLYRREDGGLSLDQMFDRPDRYFIAGMLIGGMSGFAGGALVFGLMAALLTALAGALAGLGFASLFAMLQDYGLNDDFLQKVGSELAAGSSALVVLHFPGEAQPLLNELYDMQATVIQTNYTVRDQRAVQSRLSDMLREAEPQQRTAQSF